MLKHYFLLLLIGLTIPGWARTWDAKTDWRATRDGKTDDSLLIQRGVTAMRSGDTVVFPAPGIYSIDHHTFLHNYQDIKGCEGQQFQAPFAPAKQPGSGVYTSIPVSKLVWYNNLLKGVINNNPYVGIGIGVGGRDMSNTGGVLTATVTVETVEFGMRGAVFSIVQTLILQSRTSILPEMRTTL